jgi:hypothetical protein
VPFGIPNIPNLDDFAICIDFTANSLPAAGAFNILFRLSKRTEDANFIGLWITTSASGVTTIASQVGTTGVASWITALTVGVRYRVVLTRQNGNILGYLNGIDEFAAVNAATLAGVQEWAVGNRLGVSDPATQQLNGTIRRVVVVSGKLFAADFSA